MRRTPTCPQRPKARSTFEIAIDGGGAEEEEAEEEEEEGRWCGGGREIWVYLLLHVHSMFDVLVKRISDPPIEKTNVGVKIAAVPWCCLSRQLPPVFPEL